MRVIRILAGHFFQRQIAQANYVDRRSLPTAIARPGGLPEQVRHVSNARSIRRKPCLFPAPHWQNSCRAALNGHSVEAVEVRIGFAPGIKEDPLAVRSPS